MISGLAAGNRSHAVLKTRQYELFWSISNGTIEFELNVNTKGWVGIGFAPTPSMTGADLIISGLNDETGRPYIYVSDDILGV